MSRNLLRLKDLTLAEIEGILDQAQDFCDGERCQKFAGKIVCNLFFEPSTRTLYSFQVAQENLGLKVISFNPGNSSLQKDECFYDTVKTFDSFKTDLLVIRHSQNEYYNEFVGKIKTPIINGGDGTGQHPTQSLLDLLTIRQEFGHLDGLSVAIIGDVAHSRVAHTNFEIMKRFGMQVYTSGPPEYMEEGMNFIPFEQALARCDIIMALRIQHERHKTKFNMSLEEYHQKYGLNAQTVGLMKKNAIIMHPAPVNRNVEIADELVESSRSRIFKQMQNGVFIRMAVIKYALGED
ncbi:aspartate carbamoyltransferase [Clostridia bacterium]|nr:aspartate carbamoyltransferase [Clostridia bacterium]